MLRDALHAQRDLVDLERLGQVIVRAFFHRGDGVLHRRKRRHQDDCRFRRLLARLPEQRQAIQFGQANVANHQVERARPDQFEGLGPVFDRGDAVAGVAEGLTREQLDVGLVVDQEHVETVRRRSG